MMARCIQNYGNRTMHSDRYEENCLEDDDIDEDEDDFDDEDADFYDGLSDYGDEDTAHSRGYSRHGLSNTLDDRGASSGSDPRRQRSVSESSLGLLESGEDNRRDHHNQLERKRRASIKTSYNDLREVIPSLSGSKASRAVILQRAVEYIEDLVKMNWEHTVCVEKLRRQNDILDSQVQGMQRTMQRLDGEEAAVCFVTSGSVASTQNPSNSYRIAPTNGNSNSTSANHPVYRVLPQDNETSEKHSGPSTTLSQITNSSGTRGPSTSSTLVLSNRNRTSPVLQYDTSSTTLSGSGLSTVSPVMSLVGSTNSAFSSSVSSSNGSNGVLIQSSSQRSSPNDLSSVSSSSTSSSNLTSERSTTLDDYPPSLAQTTIPLVVDPIPIHTAAAAATAAAATTPATTLIKPQSRSVRAPSPIQLVGNQVFLNHVPIRSRSTTSESDSSNSQTKEIRIRSYDLSTGSALTTLSNLSDRSKRRKLN